MAKGKTLNQNQKAFVREFLLCRNASEAYRKAYPKAKNPDVDSAQLMKNPLVKAEVSAWEEAQKHKFDITAETLLQELAAVAFFDLRSVMNEDSRGVSMKSWREMPPHVSKAIQQVSESNNEFGGSISVKGYDKIAAIEKLGRRLGLWKNTDEPGSRSREEARRNLFERLSGHFSKPKE